MPKKSRKTRQKEIIKDEVQKMTSFFSSEDLFKKVSKKEPAIGIATIYRYLKEQKSSGKIHSYRCGKKIIYSVGEKSHCHFTCEKTGKTLHFEIGDLNFLKGKVPGKITSIQLEVTGICEKCSK